MKLQEDLDLVESDIILILGKIKDLKKTLHLLEDELICNKEKMIKLKEIILKLNQK